MWPSEEQAGLPAATGSEGRDADPLGYLILTHTVHTQDHSSRL